MTALFSAQLAAWVGLRARGSREAALVAITMAATAWWAAGNAAEDLAADLPSKLLLANLQYLAIAALPVLWCALGWTLDRDRRTGNPGKLSSLLWIPAGVTAARSSSCRLPRSG